MLMMTNEIVTFLPSPIYQAVGELGVLSFRPIIGMDMTGLRPSHQSILGLNCIGSLPVRGAIPATHDFIKSGSSF